MEYRRRAEQSVSLLTVLAVWMVATMVLANDPSLPTPPQVLTSLVDAATGGYFWSEVTLSTFRVYLSYVIAVVVGIPLGLLIGRSELVEDLLFPSLEVLRPIPPIAWFPALTIILFSPENIVRFIIFLAAFFPILLNTIEGVHDVEEEYAQAASSLGASASQSLRHVVLPGALPSIYTGLVNAMGLAWVSLVAAEVLSSSGLGYFIWNAFTAGEYPNVVVGMITVGVLGYTSSVLVRWLGAQQLPWLQSAT
ncbi:ABC transporter permease [Haloarcula nitratireducens]|uniref:ABC transporter permease n=1 Tax=Haloarcula nitratireducens TaxID=2487749 RepID=A0AAW4PJ06_9EURY|nr:ABC transporter permease [Halomicroarcula nitratireducens]MBX0297984.1 ABC transporter permease [Halomicroarcula nitratireducens]